MIFNNFSNPQYWLSLLYSIPAVLIALSFHEWAHAWVAYKCGDSTARAHERLSLDPLKHLDPIGTLCLLFFGFGWAKPVPVNPRNYKNPRRDDILVSLAGIIMNFIVSFIAYGIFLGVGTFWKNEIFMNIMYPIVTLNITLGLFNLLPIPPLDGFHVVTALFPRSGAKFQAAVGKYGMIIVLLLLFSGIVGWVLNGVTSWLLSMYHAFWGMLF